MYLKVLQWNCRGIYRKILAFKHYIADLTEAPDVIELHEIHLIQKYNPRIKNYPLIRRVRNVHGGGICFFIKNNLPFNEVELDDLGQCGPNRGPRTTFVRPSTILTIVVCLVSCNTTWSVKIILKIIAKTYQK